MLLGSALICGLETLGRPFENLPHKEPDKKEAAKKAEEHPPGPSVDELSSSLLAMLPVGSATWNRLQVRIPVAIVVAWACKAWLLAVK